ncbi:MAG: hypothetical protein FWD39_03400 [Clostridiales bacterium]|nr:hypothetical protein [Clostridiales bacterium]
MSAWQEPKTDWRADDFFRLADYQRITGNILWLAQEAASQLNQAVSLASMTAAAAGMPCRPAFLNAVESNASLLAGRFRPDQAPPPRVFAGGDAFWDHADLNRLEQNLLQTRFWLEWKNLSMPYLGTFYLGGS